MLPCNSYRAIHDVVDEPGKEEFSKVVGVRLAVQNAHPMADQRLLGLDGCDSTATAGCSTHTPPQRLEVVIRTGVQMKYLMHLGCLCHLLLHFGIDLVRHW